MNIEFHQKNKLIYYKYDFIIIFLSFWKKKQSNTLFSTALTGGYGLKNGQTC